MSNQLPQCCCLCLCCCYCNCCQLYLRINTQYIYVYRSVHWVRANISMSFTHNFLLCLFLFSDAAHPRKAQRKTLAKISSRAESTARHRHRPCQLKISERSAARDSCDRNGDVIAPGYGDVIQRHITYTQRRPIEFEETQERGDTESSSWESKEQIEQQEREREREWETAWDRRHITYTSRWLSTLTGEWQAAIRRRRERVQHRERERETPYWAAAYHVYVA